MERKGFTFVEVLVTVVIVGILATVAVPRILNAIERTNRKIDATNAVELSNILRRAFESETVVFPAEKDNANNLNPDQMSIAVIVLKDGINYYLGSGQVLVNGGDWTSDNGDAYRRIRKLFEDAGFTNVEVRAKLADGGWTCYGSVLFGNGSTRIFSAQDESKCKTSSTGGAYENFISESLSSAASNPIAVYLPAGAK